MTQPAPSPTPIMIDLDTIPPVDTNQHSVPLEQVYFDTFRRTNRAVPLSAAQPELIRTLLDAIPPIYNPVWETAAAADEWLRDGDLVLGYADSGEAFAYPVRILNFHEMVSHEVNGRPILASYCPLCRSGIVYDRAVNGQTLLFGNTSALYESDMVMVDHQTGSYWMQVSGEAIVGKMTGARLAALPSQTTTWEVWKQQYPHTLSLSRDTGNPRDYNRDPFSGYGEFLNENGRFAFPVSDQGRDPRLEPGAVVLSVTVGETIRVYPLAAVGDGVLNDVVGETAVAVFGQAKGPTGAAYAAVVDGRSLTFTFVDGLIRDEETGSTWDFSGQAISGELAGAQLGPLPGRSTFWFAMIAAFPELELYTGQ